MVAILHHMFSDRLVMCIKNRMVGRGTARIANAIDRLIAEMAQERQNRAQPVNEELRKLDLFEKRNPPRFKGGYDLEGA